MRIILMLLCFAAAILPAQAEEIDGPANVRDKPNGKLLFSIEDGQHVYASELVNNWSQIILVANVRLVDLKNDTILYKNSKLYADDFQTVIGTSLTDFNIAANAVDADNDDFVKVALRGYTYSGNIKPASVLERRVEQAVNPKTTTSSLQALKGDFLFNFYEDVEGFDVWTVYENSSPFMSNDFRMMIYFESSGSIIGIACHRKLNLKAKTTSSIDRNYKMYYINPPSIDQKVFEKLMTDAFAVRD